MKVSTRTDPTRRRGAAAFEAVVCLLVCMSSLLGVVEFGRYQMTRQLLTNGAQQGARLAAVSARSGNTAQIQADVTSLLAGVQLGSQTVLVQMTDQAGNPTGTWTNAGSGQYIGVTVSGTFTPMVPSLGLLPQSTTMFAQAVIRCEVD